MDNQILANQEFYFSKPYNVLDLSEEPLLLHKGQQTKQDRLAAGTELVEVEFKIRHPEKGIGIYHMGLAAGFRNTQPPLKFLASDDPQHELLEGELKIGHFLANQDKFRVLCHDDRLSFKGELSRFQHGVVCVSIKEVKIRRLTPEMEFIPKHFKLKLWRVRNQSDNIALEKSS